MTNLDSNQLNTFSEAYSSVASADIFCVFVLFCSMWFTYCICTHLPLYPAYRSYIFCHLINAIPPDKVETCLYFVTGKAALTPSCNYKIAQHLKTISTKTTNQFSKSPSYAVVYSAMPLAY